MKWVTALVDLSLLFLLSQIVNTKGRFNKLFTVYFEAFCVREVKTFGYKG